jgi:hypothetical protein
VDDLFRDLSPVHQGLSRVVGTWGYRGLFQRDFRVLLFLQMGLVVQAFGLLRYIHQAPGCDTATATATAEFEDV